MESYLPEAFFWMRVREKRLPDFKKRSSQSKEDGHIRRYFVDWVCQGGEKFSMPQSTIHLAVIISDRFIQSRGIDKIEPMTIVCMASLSIAAKFDDREPLVPKFKKLKTLMSESERSNISITNVELGHLEATILAFFQWNVFIPTPTHYTDLVHDEILHEDDLYNGHRILSKYYDEIKDNLKDFVKYFLNISMQVCQIYCRIYSQGKFVPYCLFYSENKLRKRKLFYEFPSMYFLRALSLFFVSDPFKIKHLKHSISM